MGRNWFILVFNWFILVFISPGSDLVGLDALMDFYLLLVQNSCDLQSQCPMLVCLGIVLLEFYEKTIWLISDSMPNLMCVTCVLSSLVDFSICGFVFQYLVMGCQLINVFQILMSFFMV